MQRRHITAAAVINVRTLAGQPTEKFNANASVCSSDSTAPLHRQDIYSFVVAQTHRGVFIGRINIHACNAKSQSHDTPIVRNVRTSYFQVVRMLKCVGWAVRTLCMPLGLGVVDRYANAVHAHVFSYFSLYYYDDDRPAHNWFVRAPVAPCAPFSVSVKCLER